MRLLTINKICVILSETKDKEKSGNKINNEKGKLMEM